MLDVNMIYRHFTDSAKFESVRMKPFGASSAFVCSIECSGAFCYFRAFDRVIPIFTPNMPPEADDESPSISLLAIDEPHVRHELTFPSLKEKLDFLSFFFKSMEFVQSLVKRLDFRKYSLTEDLQYFNQRTRSWQKVATIIQFFGTDVLFQTHVKTGSELKPGLSLKITPSMFVTTRFELPIRTGKLPLGFRIVPNSSKLEECHIFKCETEKSMQQWVLTLYYLICQSRLGDFEVDPPDWEKPVVEYEYEYEEEVVEQAPTPAAEQKNVEEYEYEYVLEEEEEEVKEKVPEAVLKFEDDETEEKPAEDTATNEKVEEEDEEEEKKEKIVDEQRYSELMTLIETGIPVKVFAHVTAEQTEYTQDTTVLDKRCEKLRQTPNPVVKHEDFVMPVLQAPESVQIDKKETEGLLKLFGDAYNESYEFTEMTVFEDVSAESVIETSLREFEEANIVRFDKFFDFTNFPFISADSFVSRREPLNPFFIRLLSAVNSIVNQEPAAVSLAHGTKFVSMLAALLLNGSRNLSNFYASLVEFTTCCEAIKPIVDRLNSTDPPESVSVSFVIEALNRNVLKIFLRDAHRNEEWEKKYYSRSSLIRYGNVLETVLEQLSRLDIFPFLLSGKFTDLDDVTKFTPEAFQFVEIDEEGVDVVTFLEHTMDNSLKSGITLGGTKAFDFIEELCEKYEKLPDKDINEIIQVFMSLRGDTIFDRKMKQRQKIHDFWMEGLRRKKLHIWFLFMVVDQDLVKKYYEEDASLADLYRANYITVKLYHRMQST